MKWSRFLPAAWRPAPQPRQQLLASLLHLAWVVEARDPYTGGHLWRVAQFSRLLAQAAGLSEAEVARVALGGFLHDLGKIAIPDAILGKKERLNDEEYAVIRTHPESGLRLLGTHPLALLARDAVLLHHETPDGNGYPYGLRSDAIPLVARIVGICDAFDAMTSTRPYRNGMPIAKALSIIRLELGRQFDGELGELFLTLGDGAALAHIVGHTDEGIPLECCLSCGPTVVRPREAQTGDALYCPACHSEYTLGPAGAGILPSGRQDSARALSIAPDAALIERLVEQHRAALD